MKNTKTPRFRITVKRVSGIREYDRLRIKQLKDTIIELKELGENPSVTVLEPIVLEYILLRDKRLKVKDKIESITMEPDV